jgi:PAS domain S-box-containing protein
MRRLEACFGAGENVTFESLHRRKDGTVFPVEVRTGRFQRGGRLYRLALVRDITERKRTEAELSEIRERYRVLTESSLTGIYLTEGTRFVYVNPAMAKTFGYTVEELVGGGGGSLDLTCPEDRHLVAENMRRRLDGEVGRAFATRVSRTAERRPGGSGQKCMAGGSSLGGARWRTGNPIDKHRAAARWSRRQHPPSRRKRTAGRGEIHATPWRRDWP